MGRVRNSHSFGAPQRNPSVEALLRRSSHWHEPPCSFRRPEAWHNARQHAFHRLPDAAWWDPSEKNTNDRENLPPYYGWPTAGPTGDKMLLKSRQAMLQGHVDWVQWTRETGDSMPRRPSRSPSRQPMYRPVNTESSWLPNYGVMGPDDHLHWPGGVRFMHSNHSNSAAMPFTTPIATTEAEPLVENVGPGHVVDDRHPAQPPLPPPRHDPSEQLGEDSGNTRAGVGLQTPPTVTHLTSASAAASPAPPTLASSVLPDPPPVLAPGGAGHVSLASFPPSDELFSRCGQSPKASTVSMTRPASLERKESPSRLHVVGLGSQTHGSASSLLATPPHLSNGAGRLPRVNAMQDTFRPGSFGPGGVLSAGLYSSRPPAPFDANVGTGLFSSFGGHALATNTSNASASLPVNAFTGNGGSGLGKNLPSTLPGVGPGMSIDERAPLLGGYLAGSDRRFADLASGLTLGGVGTEDVPSSSAAATSQEQLQATLHSLRLLADSSDRRAQQLNAASTSAQQGATVARDEAWRLQSLLVNSLQSSNVAATQKPTAVDRRQPEMKSEAGCSVRASSGDTVAQEEPVHEMVQNSQELEEAMQTAHSKILDLQRKAMRVGCGQRGTRCSGSATWSAQSVRERRNIGSLASRSQSLPTASAAVTTSMAVPTASPTRERLSPRRVVFNLASSNCGSSAGINEATISSCTDRCTLSQASASLGVLRLACGSGSDHFGDATGFGVFYRTVAGLTLASCQGGQSMDGVQAEFVQAVKWLDARGVSGITGDSSSMLWLQRTARSLTGLPVFLSPLCQMPTVLRTHGSGEKIAILTLDAIALERMHQLIVDECGVDLRDEQFVVVDCGDVPGFTAEALDVERANSSILARARRVVLENPTLHIAVLESTRLLPFADALRVDMGWEVYDAITCCNSFLKGEPSR